MANKKKIYCVYCGSENLYEDDYCKKCKKKLNPKNHLFRDFLYDHIKDDIKGNVEDNIFSLIKNFIISHLYGSSLIVAVLFTATVMLIANFSHNSNVTNITSVQDMLNSNASSTYMVTLYTYDDYCTATFDVPTTDGYFITGDKYKLTSASIKKGSTLAKWCQKNKESLLCTEKLRIIDSDLEKVASEYKAFLDEYSSWYETCKNDRASNTCRTQYADYNNKLGEYMYRLTSDRKNDNKFFDVNTKVDKNINLYIPIVENCNIIGGYNEVQ